MKVIIVSNGKKYELFGVERIEPSMQYKKGLFIYFTEKMDGLYTQAVKNAKIETVSICDLPNSFITEETKKELGFIRL